MAGTSLTTLSFTPDPSFNWFFLLELIVSVILVLFFLLYFNRLFATLLSYGIRAYTWHYYRAYVDFNALQVSLLGGRVFFKGIRYHGENETIFVHGGFITWHYWKRSVRKTELDNLEPRSENGSGYASREDNGGSESNDRGEQGGLKKSDARSCRVTVKFYGLEWFIYNRTAAYDSILAGFGLPNDDERSPSSSTFSKPYGDQSVGLNSPDTETKENQDGPSATRTTSSNKPSEDNRGLGRGDTFASQNAPGSGKQMGESLSTLLQLLPMKLVCDKGAIVIGNENTRSVLTTTFDSALGSIEACNAGPLDLYRQIFSFQLSHPIIQMRPNPDFKQNQLAAAKGLSSAQEDEPETRRKRDTMFSYRFQKRRVWHSIRDLVPYFQTSVESFHLPERYADAAPRNQGEIPDGARWIGLSRYLDESTHDDHEEWNSIEYGRFSTLLDSPSVTVGYFWDIPGCVVPEHAASGSSTHKPSPDINGSPPPEWGIDVKIEGGSINYGPWADRERVGLQNVLFPNAYHSSQPAERLAVGDLRQNTIFKFRVELTEETTLRIPTREPSKDWQWKGRADAIRGTSKLKKPQQQKRQSRNKEGEKGNIGPDIRPFGWLSLRVAGDSTINYTMDMVASSSGYHNQLDLDLRDSRMSSSVNHGLLWQCPQQLLTCDLSNPLSWNALRTWKFDVHSHDMELFLIRDHIFLITDLVTDWASGPPSDYHTFVPFIYNLNLSFSDLRLFVNVNDLNIISNPSDLDDNRFIVIKGKKFTSDVLIPLNKFKPEKSAVDFKLKLEDGGIEFLTPLWDTLHTFLQDKSVATLDTLLINGTYDYYSSTSSELTDTLTLDIDGVSPRLYLFGFLIQYFMTVRENYFGEEMHFKTLEEFQELAYPHEQTDTHNGMNPNNKSNDLDVIVHVAVDNPCALLPENIYDQLEFVQLRAAALEVDLRFTNYYMDLHFALSPLKAALETHDAGGSVVTSDTQLFIDGLTIHGHRLFGLPPVEPTYVCNWDFSVGQIIGECSTEFLSSLLAGLKSFDLSFDNEENKLPPLTPIILHDVTFLRAKLDKVHISVLLDQAALILSSGPVTTKFNDWADSRFSKRMSLLIPELSLAAIERHPTDGIQSFHDGKVSPLAIFQTTISLKMAARQSDIGTNRRLQQEHIKLHDQRTQRTQWLLFDWEDLDPNSLPSNSESLEPPTIAIPSMPEPIIRHPHILGSSSLRHLSESKSASSFLVSSDSLSLKSARKRAARSIYSASSSVSQNASNHESERTTRRDTGIKRHMQTPSAGIETFARHSNLWAMPNFSLHKIVLDMSQLPSQKVPDSDSQNGNDSTTNANQLFSPFDDDGITHTNFACELPAGIRGFCTPEFLFQMSALTEQLQPVHPVKVIDSLHKEVISDIIGYEKSMSKPKTSTAFAVRVPLVVLKLINSTKSPSNHDFSFQDEYIIGISHVKTEFRSKVERQKNDLLAGIKDSTTLHAAADSLSVTVRGCRTDVHQETAEISCIFGDLNFWLLTAAPAVRSHIQMRSFDTVTSSKSVEYLASLVRRSTTMFDSVTSSFKHSSSLGSKRLRFLIYFLTQPAVNIPDPAFLTRISYVLRVAPTHLRQHDSWKIISRIRNVFNNMSSDQQQQLIWKLKTNDVSLPSNAKSIVLSSFDKWRAWDLAHVEKSYVMRRVWNVFDETSKTPNKSVSVSSDVKFLRFSIDSGPRESDFIVQDLSTHVSISPQPQNDSDQDLKLPTKVIILQSYCSSVSLQLRWEILDLVEGIIRTMSTVTLESAASPEAPSEVSGAQNELQVVIGTDLGSIILDGINVQLELTGKALRGSLVHKSHGSKGTNEDLSLLLSATECSSQLSSLSDILMLWKIGKPYVYCSRISQESETEVKHEWKIAGSCKRLRYEMREDPLSLAHTADRLIADEIRYIRAMMQGLDLQTHQPDEITTAKQKPVHNKLQIATFLDDYQLSFCLLPSLIYTISGEVARLSVMPQKESMIEVDFDLKKNTHSFMSGEGGRWHTLSAADIPPINGRVNANLLPARTEVEVDVTIELIRFEASALRSLVGALTGPEVSHMISDLKQNIEVLQAHLDDVLVLEKRSSQAKDHSDNGLLLYKARLTMAGTEIHATAPGLGGKNYSADMQFSLGMMRMRLDNGLDDGTPMEYPEFHVDASQIRLDLRRQEKPSSRSYGSIAIDAKLHGTSITRENGETARVYHLSSNNFDIELFTETTTLVVDIAVHLQERIKTLDLSHEVKRFKKLRQRGQTVSKATTPSLPDIQVNDESSPQDFLNAVYSLEFNNIQIAWNMATSPSALSGRQPDDLVFSIKRVDLSNKRKNAAKLRIEHMQLQMVPYSAPRQTRSLTSALMPELVFNVAYSLTGKEVRLAFQAAGKSLDMRATSDFILPASMIRDSIASAAQTIREANTLWAAKPSQDNTKDRNLFGNKRLRSVLVDVDFAGAVVSLQGRHTEDQQTTLTATLKGSRLPEGKYGQYVQGEAATTATFRAPGVAFKVQFEDNGNDDPALNAEMKVDASTNVLYPTLVPLIKQMSATVKELMGEQTQTRPRRQSTTMMLQPQKLMQETPLNTNDPHSILGRCRVNVGLLISKQEFSLSCQPIARVAATAKFDSVYVTINTVQSDEHGRFIALQLAFNSLEASVKHVYSNESTASFEVKSMVMSLMNSKHLSSTKGIAAVLRVSPMKVALNAKQVQDLLLFREIWLPSNDEPSTPTFQPEPTETQTYIVQRYQQVASTSAFPWNTTIAIEQLEIQLDLGSTLGKAQFAIDDLWLSSKKTSEREQTLCISFGTVAIESKGRMSGLVELQTLKVRTSIQWPDDITSGQTPLIQASVSFHQLEAKVSFDYQPFLVAHIAMFYFLMYNVRGPSGVPNERLFSILEGDKVQVFCTTLTASQSLALLQAWQRLALDKQAAYEASLREIDRYLRRKSSVHPEKPDVPQKDTVKKTEDGDERAPISLQTGVVVTIKAVHIGVFPSSLFDNQILKLEANDAQARFDVSLVEGRIQSALGLTLGQLRVALSGINRPSSAEIEELSVHDIANRVIGSRGGTILKVPQLVAGMQTWQSPGSNQIDYIFQSTFEGKVDVGWNYSRISFIRDMWETHSRALASRLGKPLPPSAVQITGGPTSERDGEKHDQEKITAVVNVPQSKYTYTALEPPVIETPQLRDMGEATPPLEWIGLQRDKLPNVTHQIIIVTLLEIAKEVEDAYAKILGSS